MSDMYSLFSVILFLMDQVYYIIHWK